MSPHTWEVKRGGLDLKSLKLRSRRPAFKTPAAAGAPRRSWPSLDFSGPSLPLTLTWPGLDHTPSRMECQLLWEGKSSSQVYSQTHSFWKARPPPLPLPLREPRRKLLGQRTHASVCSTITATVRGLLLRSSTCPHRSEEPSHNIHFEQQGSLEGRRGSRHTASGALRDEGQTSAAARSKGTARAPRTHAGLRGGGRYSR